MTEPNLMQGLTHLAMNGQAGKARDFHAAAFGAEDRCRIPLPDGQPRLRDGVSRAVGIFAENETA